MTSLWTPAIPTLVAAATALLWLPYLSPTDLRVRRVMVFLFLGMQIRYSVWRIEVVREAAQWTFTWAACLAFLVFELGGYLINYRGLRLYARWKNRTEEANMYQDWWRADAAPLVDVFICTFNESATILERTIMGARALDHPRVRVWLLDDGRREWVRTIAQHRGIGYITRQNNEHYKAGNLNNALEHVRGLSQRADFVAVFDADFIPRPSFIRRTLALMHDQKVGLVQTPQYFYNPDPFQYVFGAFWPDEQRSWFDVRLPSLDAVGAATCCGTSFLVRAKALDALGEFPVESVCEDTLTSLKLRRLGWQTAYLHEVQSVGLAPEGVMEFITQRTRWGLGGLELALHREVGPLAGGRFPERYLNFLEAFLRWPWYAATKTIWFAVPVAYCLFGFSVYQASWNEFCSYIGPLTVVRVAFTWLNAGTSGTIVTDGGPMLILPAAVRTVARVVTGRRGTFSITDKGVQRGGGVIHWGPLMVPLALALLTLAALLISLLDPYSPFNVGGRPSLMLIILLMNLFLLYVPIAVCFEPPKYRAAERYQVGRLTEIVCGGRSSPGRLVDLSESGARVRCEGDLTIGSLLSIALPGVGMADAQVIRRTDDSEWGVMLVLSDEQKQLLMFELYCTEHFVRFISSWNVWVCARSVLSHFCAPRSHGHIFGEIHRFRDGRARSDGPGMVSVGIPPISAGVTQARAE